MPETMGEKKVGICLQCQSEFPMVRYDQKYCSRPCGVKYANAHAAPWIDRADREKQNRIRKERWDENRESYLAELRRKRQENPERFRERERRSYRKNKEKHKARVAAYRAAHPEMTKRSRQNYRLRRPWFHMLKGAKKRSLSLGLPFDLTEDWMRKTWTGFCSVSGLPLTYGPKNHHVFSPSIDRIIPSLGYTQANCRIVCFAVNALKGIGTDEDMYKIAEAITNTKTSMISDT